eukprot:TRINITY_DN10520_c0_g1_i2.p1 TRINITY_DN10520_c0_g1~~TRINITY_DN10520_c0_g1_i2.p1  ORF type:complete len:294 (+),score=64.18 TRINITY_DN10520_c0_g1_i2:195-1076(+)
MAENVSRAPVPRSSPGHGRHLVESLVEYPQSSAAGEPLPEDVSDADSQLGLWVQSRLVQLWSKDSIKSVLVLLLFIGIGTVETVDYSVNGKKYMYSYLTILNLLVVGVAAVFFSLIVLIQYHRGYYSTEGDGLFDIVRGSPKWFLGNISLMALCDTFALYMAILASREVSAPLRNLLQQGNIPITMILSRLFLGHRYCWSHLVGAGLIVGGIGLVIWQISDDSSGLDSSQSESDVGWSVAFFLSCIPMSLSICLKEHVLNHPKHLSLIHISEPTRLLSISYAVFCLKKKKKNA